MSRKIFFTVTSLLVLSALLAACGLQATQTGPVATELVPNQTVPTAVLLPSADTLTYITNLIDTLPSNQGYGVIQPPDLKTELESGSKPFLVDVREPADVEAKGFIDGAVNIPIRQILRSLDKMPSPETKIVLYDGNGNHAGMALAALKLLGYSDVRFIGGGFSSWSKGSQFPIVSGTKPPEAQVVTASPSIPDKALYDLLDSFLTSLPADYFITDAKTLSSAFTSAARPILIDVRTVKERQDEGYIQDSISVPFSDFFKNTNQLPALDAPIVIYSGGGGRASIVVMGLRIMGYSNVYNLDGGMFAWKAANLPVVSGEATPQP